MNETKATITELETAGEEQIDDISSLVNLLFSFFFIQCFTTGTNPTIKYVLKTVQEEVAQENQQKIEVEKQTVQEAKTELDKHRKMAEDADSKYASVRERIDQLSEEMESLKVKIVPETKGLLTALFAGLIPVVFFS